MGIPYFIVLCFIVFHRNFISYGLKVCDNIVLNKFIGIVFSTAFAHFMSLCHMLLILTAFKTSLFSFLIENGFWLPIAQKPIKLQGLWKIKLALF